ncbi:hypothetical protein WK56_16735 [Burkholderia ubonensis]|nr:hypothetical protein WK56_16735 [Burkholderia ubonensis]
MAEKPTNRFSFAADERAIDTVRIAVDIGSLAEPVGCVDKIWIVGVPGLRLDDVLQVVITLRKLIVLCKIIQCGNLIGVQMNCHGRI